MNKQKPTFFYDLCRLCLEAEGICDIFETDNLLQDIYSCTGVIIFVSDKLPHKICSKCLETIKYAKKFRVFVKQNDVHLRSLFTADPEGDIIKTIACQTSKEICEPKNISKEVQSSYYLYFENGDKEDTDQIKIEPHTESNDESIFEAGPVVVQTTSLRKDLLHSSSEATSPTKAEFSEEADPYVRILEEKVRIENVSEKIKTEEDEATDYICGSPTKTKFNEEADSTLEEQVKIENISEKMKTDEDEATDYTCGAGPVVVQTISLRKDLLRSSSASSCCKATSSTKTEFSEEKDPYIKILEEKVKNEKLSKKIITEKAEDIEYICGICSKAFLTYKKLYLHQRLHNKQIVCPLHPCGKKFATQGDLQKHVRTHTGEKPYVCEFCNKGFSQRVSLRNHVDSRHHITNVQYNTSGKPIIEKVRWP